MKKHLKRDHQLLLVGKIKVNVEVMNEINQF